MCAHVAANMLVRAFPSISPPPPPPRFVHHQQQQQPQQQLIVVVIIIIIIQVLSSGNDLGGSLIIMANAQQQQQQQQQMTMMMQQQQQINKPNNNNISEIEANALLKFKGSLSNATALSNWNPTTSPCSGWYGVRCLADRVWVLQLRGMSLSGNNIDIEALVPLPQLRAISLINNNLQGPFPHFNSLGPLKSIYISYNNFSGQIPDDAFTRMRSLKKVFLAYNHFHGTIPSSLATLPKLLDLRIEGNLFEGQLPNFQQKSLRLVNVSHNLLEGPIPHSLSNMNITSFLGNDYLCGQPLDPCSPYPPLWKVAIGVFVAGLAIGVIVMIIIMIIHRSRRRRRRRRGEISCNTSSSISTGGGGQRTKSGMSGGSHYNRKSGQLGGGGGGGSTHRGGGRKGEQSSSSSSKLQLCFVREVDDGERFDLQDLLRASAEVLGSGNFGSSYKATISNGQSLVVKRYKQMSGIGREDFCEHMRRLGKLKHANLLTLTAYYYRKEEKLLVYDYVANSCLATHLHGKRQAGGLEWRSRLKIIKGVCRGLSYLYNELPNLAIPHGHLKSSNVLLDESFEPLLTDYALAPVTNPEHARQLMVAYRSPESSRVSKKSDIWSLGTLILETLTGKFPVNYISQQDEDDEDLASWVVATINDGKTGEVFDKEMSGTKDCKGEMIKLLKIGLSCCDKDIERRLSIAQVVEKVEELRDKDNNNDNANAPPPFAATASFLKTNSSSRAVIEDASR